MILYSQVTTLVGDVDTSLKKACVTVKETSGSADKVLKDVVSATQTMTTSTSTCLSNFDTFISKEGKVTQNALATHFTALDTYLATQSEDISTVSAASQKVRNAFSSFFLFPFGPLFENSFLSQHIIQLCAPLYTTSFHRDSYSFSEELYIFFTFSINGSNTCPSFFFIATNFSIVMYLLFKSLFYLLPVINLKLY